MSPVKYNAEDIAGFFVSLANKQYIDDGVPEGITNLKLQKILYFAQAAYLSLYDKPLFEDKIEAWKFGPVIPSVYHKFKKYQNKLLPQPDKTAKLPDALVEFLESVWKIYGKYSAAELVEITHSHAPWKELFFGGNKNVEITHESLKNYYKRYFVSDGKTE